jgi:hypothetical protein
MVVLNSTILLITMGSSVLLSACTNTPSLKPPKKSAGPASPALTSFVLPRVVVADAPLEAALEQIKRSYTVIARECSTRPRTLQIAVQGMPQGTVTLDLTNVTTDRAIRRAGAQAGMKTTIRGRKIELTPPLEGGSLRIRSRHLSPTFLRRLEKESGLPQAPTDREDNYRSYLGRSLRKLGILKDPRSKISYRSTDGTLKTSAPTSDHYRLETTFDDSFLQLPRLELQIERVMFKSDPDLPVGMFTEKYAPQWLKRTSKIKGVRIQSLAPIKSRNGSYLRRETVPIRAFSTTWAGTMKDINLRAYGSGANLEFDYEHRVLVHSKGELTVTSNSDLSRQPHYRSPKIMAEAFGVASRTISFRRILPPGIGLVHKTTVDGREAE